jgi:nicotinamidase-related amidase
MSFQKHLADYMPGSSFENTDLDWLLRQHNITHLVFAGLVVNSCIETTAREANER